MSLNREHSRAQHSTAQSPCTKQQTKYVPIRVRIKKKVCAYVRACCIPFVFLGAWSSWHFQVACLHLKCCTIFFTTSVIPIQSCVRASVTGGTGRFVQATRMPHISYLAKILYSVPPYGGIHAYNQFVLCHTEYPTASRAGGTNPSLSKHSFQVGRINLL